MAQIWPFLNVNYFSKSPAVNQSSTTFFSEAEDLKVFRQIREKARTDLYRSTSDFEVVGFSFSRLLVVPVPERGGNKSNSTGLGSRLLSKSSSEVCVIFSDSSIQEMV